MSEGSQPHTPLILFLASAVILLTEIVDAFLRLIFISRKAQEEVQHKSGDQSDHHLAQQNFRNDRCIDVLRYENRQHLIRRREKHSDQRSHGDHAAGIQARSRCREAALRYDAEHCAEDRSVAADAGKPGGKFFSRLPLQEFHQQIGQIQKRDQLDRICQGVEERVQ